MKRFGALCILLLAFCGLADSAYLAEHQENGTPIICNIQGLSGCNTVAESQYSYLFGIPIAKYGVVFYSLLFVLAALELALFDQFLRRILQGVALIGVLASIYFICIQVFFIHAVCVYCIASAIIAFLSGILATALEPLRRRAPLPILQ